MRKLGSVNSAFGAAVVASVLVSGCVTTPQGPSPEEQRLARLIENMESQLQQQQADLAIGKSSQGQSIQMLSQVRRLESELRAMKGETERLQYELKSSKQRQRELYVDLDERLQRVESRPATAASSVRQIASSGTATISASTNLDDRSAYRKAFESLQAGQYDKAASGFENFLSAYPESGLRDNAQYWLGEAYYVSRNFTQAKAEFTKVINEYPGSSKLPDALLKLGYVQYELAEWPEARLRLEQVAEQFPGSTMANLAQQRLDKMASEGR